MFFSRIGCVCIDCDEKLCNACVAAHKRVKITRNHRIEDHPSSTVYDEKSTQSNGQDHASLNFTTGKDISIHKINSSSLNKFCIFISDI